MISCIAIHLVEQTDLIASLPAAGLFYRELFLLIGRTAED